MNDFLYDLGRFFARLNATQRVIGGICAFSLAMFMNAKIGHLIGARHPAEHPAVSIRSGQAHNAVPSTPPPPLTAAQLKAQRIRAIADSRLKDKTDETLRQLFAKDLEHRLLRAGMNVDVITSGPKHMHLTLKYILANKVLAFNFTEQNQESLRTMKSEGFTKFTITNGYDENWTWTL